MPFLKVEFMCVFFFFLKIVSIHLTAFPEIMVLRKIQPKSHSLIFTMKNEEVQLWR